MRTHFTGVLGGVAAAGALAALGLAGTGTAGAAVAVPAVTARGQAAAVPVGFEPVSASFYSPASGLSWAGWAARAALPAGRGWWPPAMAARAGTL
jgi:hypothetical protein